MNTYKFYNKNGDAVFASSLKELRILLNVSGEEVRKCFYPGVHTVAGIKVITL